jgi:hypothetical protein
VARPCTVCIHPNREAIDEALVRGEPNRAIARRVAVTKDALRRHAEAHLPASLVAIAGEREAEHGRSLLEQVRDLQAEALTILASAKETGRLSLALAAIREASRLLELAGKVSGEIDSGPTVNVLSLVQSSDWQLLRARILGALSDYPDARRAVVLELEAAS